MANPVNIKFLSKYRYFLAFLLISIFSITFFINDRQAPEVKTGPAKTALGFSMISHDGKELFAHSDFLWLNGENFSGEFKPGNNIPPGHYAIGQCTINYDYQKPCHFFTEVDNLKVEFEPGQPAIVKLTPPQLKMNVVQVDSKEKFNSDKHYNVGSVFIFDQYLFNDQGQNYKRFYYTTDASEMYNYLKPELTIIDIYDNVIIREFIEFG
ncbi:MAG: hypothetical protein JEZ07_13890 [Phycisphaerae bacterium]|nr:hypothetical protein [Phycisphaerae bacterium]